MAAKLSRVPTLHERETLMDDVTAKTTGFTPRPLEKLTIKRLPRSTLNIECSHFLRCSTDESAHGHAPLPYQLWLEAGKHKAPFPQKPDEQYNSNIWRNFRQAYGIVTTPAGMQVNDMIATMYPLNIPAPSKVGSYTYAKFIRETPLIKDPKMKKQALRKCDENLNEFHRLRLQSDARNPPIDKAGNILPPKSFRKYDDSKFLASQEDVSPRPQPPPVETRVDIFGKRVPKLGHTPYMWKLSYRINNPSYRQVQEDMVNKPVVPPQHPPIFTHIK